MPPPGGVRSPVPPVVPGGPPGGPRVPQLNYFLSAMFNVRHCFAKRAGDTRSCLKNVSFQKTQFNTYRPKPACGPCLSDCPPCLPPCLIRVSLVLILCMVTLTTVLPFHTLIIFFSVSGSGGSGVKRLLLSLLSTPSDSSFLFCLARFARIPPRPFGRSEGELGSAVGRTVGEIHFYKHVYYKRPQDNPRLPQIAEIAPRCPRIGP